MLEKKFKLSHTMRGKLERLQPIPHSLDKIQFTLIFKKTDQSFTQNIQNAYLAENKFESMSQKLLQQTVRQISQMYPAILILREINLEDSRSFKTAFFAVSEAINPQWDS